MFLSSVALGEVNGDGAGGEEQTILGAASSTHRAHGTAGSGYMAYLGT